MPSFQVIALSLTFCLSACFLTHYSHSLVIKNQTLGKIKSASLVTLILCFLIQWIPPIFTSFSKSHLELLVLGSTFIGMADRKTFSPMALAFISVFFFFAYESLYSNFTGPKAPGGVLGFFAFLSSLIVWILCKIKYRQHLD